MKEKPHARIGESPHLTRILLKKEKEKSCKETKFFTRALETRSLSSVSSQRKTAARREPATGKRSISLLEPIQVKVVSCC